jgi:hypothetical protein
VDWDKQVHGEILDIIDFSVNSRVLSFTMLPDRKAELVEELRSFGRQSKRALVNFPRPGGWSNWALNTFPLGRWALQSLYWKMSGKV